MIHQLFDFIACSPTASHTAATVRAMLVQAGFTELLETESWDLQPGGKYFTTRGMSALIAFQVPKKDFRAFSVVAPHGDSPCFKVKESPALPVEGQYTKLNTEVYGGMQLALWTDRPLSVAGRLAVATEDGVKGVLCDIRRDLLLIPGVAIHMNRGVNEGVKLDPQKDTLPLLGGTGADLKAMVAENAGVKQEDILSWDLYLYSRAAGTVFGADNEFIAAPRLDDLECVFSAAKVFLAADNQENVTVLSLPGCRFHLPVRRAGACGPLLREEPGRAAAGHRRRVPALRGQRPRRPSRQPGEVRPHQPLLLKRRRGGEAQPPLCQRCPDRWGVPADLPEGRGAGAGVLQQLQDPRRRHLGQPVRFPCGPAHGGYRAAPAVHALAL